MQLALHDVTRGGADYTRLYIRRIEAKAVGLERVHLIFPLCTVYY